MSWGGGLEQGAGERRAQTDERLSLSEERGTLRVRMIREAGLRASVSIIEIDG
jgi:hypothetical protein